LLILPCFALEKQRFMTLRAILPRSPQIRIRCSEPPSGDANDAGAIVRKDSLVLGVTTAATLWFSTMMGLCFGGGQLGLGTSALVLGLATLWGLKHMEGAFRQDVRASLTVLTSRTGPSDDELRRTITEGACTIISWGIR